jgi:hypothetical protein
VQKLQQNPSPVTVPVAQLLPGHCQGRQCDSDGRRSPRRRRPHAEPESDSDRLSRRSPLGCILTVTRATAWQAACAPARPTMQLGQHSVTVADPASKSLSLCYSRRRPGGRAVAAGTTCLVNVTQLPPQPEGPAPINETQSVTERQEIGVDFGTCRKVLKVQRK